MKAAFMKGALSILLASISTFGMAEDIDLFVDSSTLAVDPPNVLLVLDNGANFSASASFSACPGADGKPMPGWPSTMLNTVGGIEQCALYKVVEALTPGSVKLGVMVFNSNGMHADCPNGTGGCLVYPITALTDDADGVTGSKTRMLNWIKGWKTTGQSNIDPSGLYDDPSKFSLNIKSNTNKNAATMQEAWALFAGRRGISGRDYAAIKPTSSCGKNYVIFVGNSFNNSGTPGDGAGAPVKATLEGTLSGALESTMNALPPASLEQAALIRGPIPVSCGSSTSFTFPASNHESGGYYADEWARYMNSQGIVTYSIGMLSNQCKPEYEALLRSMGSKAIGGGKYFPTSDYSELVVALETALSEIQSVNSVFASVSLPVSVNTQGTYLNQVFVGMFRPDDNAAPRWYGNLKQYRLGYDTDNILKLLDADGNSAISSGDTGFIAECARSYWTPGKQSSSSSLYWADITQANCGTFPPQSDTPDGNMVEKGAQGYMLRNLTPASRKVLTCGSSCSATLANFNAENTAITSAALGVTADERTALINWARGANVDGEPISGKTLDEAKTMMRPSVHGDVVHSRPVAINYAASDTATPEVVVFYGANDGMLRAVNGNRNGGEELWSFVAPESYGLFKRLRENTELISYPTVTSSNAAPKPYSFDGPVTAYKNGATAWIYATMRRGGRMIYAFDVSTPASPTLLWRAGCSGAEDASCTSSQIANIGQTWAVPAVIKSAGYASLTGQRKPMLIMGGGYAPCEDSDPASCDSNAKGRSIFLLDAENGSVLKRFPTDGGVIGDITIIKDSAGLAMYAYAADLSGNVYRISGGVNTPIGEVDPADWRITKIASLGGTGNQARKFMFGPDIVVEGGTHYLMLGSGDREKPISHYANATAVQNHFFMIKDQPLSSNWLASEQENCSAAVICMSSLHGIADENTPDQSVLDSKKGWYLQLDSSEKVVTSALTIFGTVYFSTHQPSTASPDTCSANLGDSRSYSINFKNAEGLNGERYADLVGDGLPPSPVAGLVTLDNDVTVPFCIGCSASSPLEGGEPATPPSATQPKARVFWNIEQ